MDRRAYRQICLDSRDQGAGTPYVGRRCPRFGRLCAAALLVVTSRASAQSVHGRAVLGPGREPAPGIVLELLDSAGVNRVSWTFSDEQGRFLFYKIGPGRFTLRAMRIGVRPLRLPIVVGTADTSVVLRMVPVPLSLPPVVARNERSCNTRPDSGLALGSLWNDAESALLAASITRESPAYQFAVVDYTRDFDFTTRELEVVTLADARSRGARAWTSVPAARLRRDGFVIVGRDSATFIAPDIETLVSRDFIESHCFELHSRRAAADSSIGIDFTPAGAPAHPEVRGTIWLDRATHELRSIEFHYVNLGLSDADSAAGGQVRFAPLRTGGWIATDWYVKAPVVRVKAEQVVVGSVLVPDRLRVSGSTLREVRAGDDVLWSRRPSTMELHILSGAPRRAIGAGDAVAYLVGSDLRAATDSGGMLSFSNLVDGSYLVDVASRELDALGWARRRVRVDIDPRQPRKIVDVRLESPLTAARAGSAPQPPPHGDTTGVIVGRVTHGDAPAVDRQVIVAWAGRGSGAGGPRMSRTTRTMAGDGRFLVCGVPRDRAIEISVDSVASATTRLARDQVVAIVELTVPR